MSIMSVYVCVCICETMCETGRLMAIRTVWLQMENTVVLDVLLTVCIYYCFLYHKNSGVRSITTTNEYVP